MQFEILQKIKKLTCHKRTNQELFDFYKGLFSENLNVSKNEIMQFLNLVSIPRLTEDLSRDCEIILSEKDILLVIKGMPNNKSPGNDGLKKSSMRFSGRILKSLLYQVLNQHLIKVNSVILKSKVLKLIEKKIKLKNLFKIGNQYPF